LKRAFAYLETVSKHFNMTNKLTLIASLLILLTSCDPGVSFHRVVTNNTDYTLQYVKTNSIGDNDTIDIAVNEEFEYAQEMKRGRRKEYEDCENAFPYTDALKFIVKNDTSKTVEVDPLGNINWEFSTTDKSMNGGGSCNCSLRITNSDIK